MTKNELWSLAGFFLRPDVGGPRKSSWTQKKTETFRFEIANLKLFSMCQTVHLVTFKYEVGFFRSSSSLLATSTTKRRDSQSEGLKSRP